MRSIKHTTGSGHQSSRNDAKDVDGPFHEKVEVTIEQEVNMLTVPS